MQIDYIAYMDEIAEMIRCKPNVMKFLLTDPQLGLQVYKNYAFLLDGVFQFFFPLCLFWVVILNKRYTVLPYSQVLLPVAGAKVDFDVSWSCCLKYDD